MKKWFWGLIPLLIVGVLTFQSCEKTTGKQKTYDVSFDLAGLPKVTSTDLNKRNGKEDPIEVGVNESGYPECSTEAVAYVIVTIDGVEYKLGMTALSPSQTEVVQLAAGSYTLEGVDVYDQYDNLIYVAPSTASIEVTEAGLLGVPMKLTFEEWTKTKVNVDVVCWHEYSHKVYTWGWLELKYYEIKHLCFFGDVCTKFYENFGQTQYDFPAEFDVAWQYELNGQLVQDTLTSDGSGPICISYLDDVLAPENLTYSLILHTPTGDLVLVEDVPVPDGAWSGDGSWAGEDGIYLFNVGNCGTDVDGQFAPYDPLPSTVSFKLTGSLYNDGYIDMVFTDVPSGATAEIYTGAVVPSWCVDKYNHIAKNTVYQANVYSSLYPGNMPSAYSSVPWNKLNYIINNIGSYTPQQVQAAIWHFTDGTSANALSVAADNNASYMPPVGGRAIVVIDAIEGANVKTIQLMVVTVDP